METPFLLPLAFPRRAGIHTCAMHSAACQYSAATQFPRNCNGSLDAQSYCSAEINREMFGPSNHGDVYNLLQSNSANRILTRTSSVVNACVNVSVRWTHSHSQVINLVARFRVME